jgi:hypothetical protein
MISPARLGELVGLAWVKPDLKSPNGDFTDPIGRVRLIASKASTVMAMRIMR